MKEGKKSRSRASQLRNITRSAKFILNFFLSVHMSRAELVRWLDDILAIRFYRDSRKTHLAFLCICLCKKLISNSGCSISDKQIIKHQQMFIGRCERASTLILLAENKNVTRAGRIFQVIELVCARQRIWLRFFPFSFSFRSFHE